MRRANESWKESESKVRRLEAIVASERKLLIAAHRQLDLLAECLDGAYSDLCQYRAQSMVSHLTAVHGATNPEQTIVHMLQMEVETLQLQILAAEEQKVHDCATLQGRIAYLEARLDISEQEKTQLWSKSDDVLHDTTECGNRDKQELRCSLLEANTNFLALEGMVARITDVSDLDARRNQVLEAYLWEKSQARKARSQQSALLALHAHSCCHAPGIVCRNLHARPLSWTR